MFDVTGSRANIGLGTAVVVVVGPAVVVVVPDESDGLALDFFWLAGTVCFVTDTALWW
ncbi:MAG: hypothetical protein ABSC90_06785 [Acidimicrobiales bacterium]